MRSGGAIPFDRFEETVGQAAADAEAEFLLGPGDVEHSAHGSFGVAWIPMNLAGVAGEQSNSAGEFVNGNFRTAANIDRFGTLVVFKSE